MRNRRNRRSVFNVEQMECRLLLSTVPQYSIKDLGVIGSQCVYDVNSSGQMLIALADDEWNTYISGPNEQPPFTNIGSLGGKWSTGTAINDYGQATGISSDLSGRSNGFVYSNGTMTDIGALPMTLNGAMLSRGWSRPEAINNIGHVAGKSELSSTYDSQRNTQILVMHAFLWDGSIHDIGTLGGSDSFALGINDSDVVVGYSKTSPDVYHAFYYDGTIHDIGVLETYTQPDGSTINYSIAKAINNLGQIIGASSSSSGHADHAFIYNIGDGSLKDLGLPSGMTEVSASDINDLGQIVGRTGSLGDFKSYYTFIYSNDNGFIDLSTLIPKDSGFTAIFPLKIDNKSQIFAFAFDTSGQEHQLFLTPKQTPVVTWSNPADIVYGTPLSATQLNATASVPGTFTYSIAAGTVLNAGMNQALTTTFTPDDTTDYTTVTTTASINVLKAPLTVTANNVTWPYGRVLPPFTGTIVGLVNGDSDVATYTTTAVQGSWAGYYPIIPHLVDPNYDITFVNGTLTITWSTPFP